MFFHASKDPYKLNEKNILFFLAAKLNLGIPTFGRSWKLTTDSPISGVPPLLADGAGDEGTYSKIKGTLAYYETCTRVVSPTNAKAPATLLRRVTDATKRLGTYAYRLPIKDKVCLSSLYM